MRILRNKQSNEGTIKHMERKVMKHVEMGTDSQDRKYRQRWWTLLVLSVSLVLVAIDTTILNVALPSIQADLGASASALQWIVASYILVFAGLLLTMGSLGDRFGRKWLLQTGLVVFGFASLAATFSQSSGQLIATRALMGVGGAMIMPATLSIIVDVFPRGERARAIAIWSAAAGIGVPLGMVVGGWLLEHFWWGAIFLINIPLGIAIMGAGAVLVPNSKDPAPRKIDLVGALLSTAALSILVYTIIEAPERGWLDTIVVTGFIGALALGIAFVLYELRTDPPMLDVRFFKNLRLSSGAVAVSFSFLALLGTIFLFTQYLQFVQGYGPLGTGIRMVPLALGFMVGSGASDRLVVKLGSKRVVAGGLLLIGLTMASFTLLDTETAYWIIGTGLFALGAAMGATMAPATDAVMGSVPEANAGVGSALNEVTRMVGGALGVGILGSILNSGYSSNIASASTGLPAGAAAAAKNSIGAAGQIATELGGPAGEALQTSANSAFVDGFAVAMAVAAGIAFVGALLVAKFMPARESSNEPEIILEAPKSQLSEKVSMAPVPFGLED